MLAPPRCIAIVGASQSGKTSLLESLLHRMGVIERAGRGASRLGDFTPEARAHAMSVELNVAAGEFLEDRFIFVDCPGSVEFMQDMRGALPACDAAIVVCEPDDRKVPTLQLVMRELEGAGIPRLLFLNKIDVATIEPRETMALLQPASSTPLLLRQIPIFQDGIATGFIDLALERAFVYRQGAPSEAIAIPADELSREKDGRFSMLERLADFDDVLMEELVSDLEPSRDRVFGDLASELRAGRIVSVLAGSAERGNGVTRLLKALRHEAPWLSTTRARLGIPDEGPALGFVCKTQHTGFGGKLSLTRVLRGGFAEGDVVTGSGGSTARIAGLVRLFGPQTARLPEAGEGEVVGFAKLDEIRTGETLGLGGGPPETLALPAPSEPVCSLAIGVQDRKDDVRLSSALAKLVEEDPSLSVAHASELGEQRLLGQGEMHLRVTLERLERRFQVRVASARPKVSYRETIRSAASARGRHKKQTGGQGQFGDVVIEVRPLPRGEGFLFEDRITGGVVPRQYIASVEAGARDSLRKGPLGFRVVDIAVALTDGSYHSVDSSDAAFQAAARLAMSEALPKANPVLLEPILSIEIVVPTAGTARATTLVTGRRGQILGFDPRPGWTGWDTVRALIPEAEMDGFIVELRSSTAGVGSFTARFHHLTELTGRPAELALRSAST